MLIALLAYALWKRRKTEAAGGMCVCVCVYVCVCGVCACVSVCVCARARAPMYVCVRACTCVGGGYRGGIICYLVLFDCRSSCTNTGIFLVVRLLSTVKGADWTIASDIRGE